jgi:nucleolar complex protein 3
LLSNSCAQARGLVRRSLEEVFRGDLRGEVSMEATRLINHLVKSRKHNVKTDVVDVMLALRIKNVNLDKEKAEELEMKKKEARKRKLEAKAKDSKQERKRKKKLEGLEKELLEARGEEGKKVKDRYFTEVTKMVFLIYFRILKSFPKSNLMGSVLEGLSRFAHVINIEFFSDLVVVFKQLLSSGNLGLRDQLLTTSTVFAILSGQGEQLNIDPTSFYQVIYGALFSISATSCTASTTGLALRSLHDMLVKRRKKVSKARVLAFTKRLGSVALQLEQGGAAGAVSVLRGLHTTHPVTAQLLDPEHEVGSGVFDPSLPDPEHCCASNTTAWEHALLAAHYHPSVRALSEHVVAGCPSTGHQALPNHLKLKETEMVEAFSSELMVFNPPVEPPAKKAKKVRGCAVSAAFLQEADTPDPALLDLHTLITASSGQPGIV